MKNPLFTEHNLFESVGNYLLFFEVVIFFAHKSLAKVLKEGTNEKQVTHSYVSFTVSRPTLETVEL